MRTPFFQKDSVEKANFALRTAGVQVWVERIEKYLMPTFWVSDNGAAQPTWSQVWAQFRGPYPSVTASWPFNASDAFGEKHWGHATTIRTGNPREIIIYVAECSLGGDGARVHHGASSFIGDREIIESARAFTHEVGHVLGLEHTMHWTEPWKAATGSASYCDVAFDSTGRAHVAYRATPSTVTYTSSADGWKTVPIASGTFIAIAADKAGNSHVAYSFGGSIHYAK